MEDLKQVAEQIKKQNSQRALQDEQVAERTSATMRAVEKIGTDIKGTATKSIKGIGESAKKTITNIPSLAMAGLDPSTQLIFGKIGGIIKSSFGYVKSLGQTIMSDEDETNQAQEETTEKVEQFSESNENSLMEVKNSVDDGFGRMLAFMQGQSFEDYERQREEAIERQRMHEESLAAAEDGGAGVAGDGDAAGEGGEGMFDFIKNFKEKLLGIGAGLVLFKDRIKNAGKSIAGAGRSVARAGASATKSVARTALRSAKFLGGGRGRAVAAGVTAAGVGIKSLLSGGNAAAAGARPPTPGGPRAGTASRLARAVVGSSSGATPSSGARPPTPGGPSGGAGSSVSRFTSSVSQTSRAAIKYPRLMKFLSRIKGIPLLTPLVAGISGIMIASNDEMPENKKKEELTALIGGTLAGAGGAKLGAILGGLAGTALLPGIGTGIGGIAGLLGGGALGYFFGDSIARTVAGALLEDSSGESIPMPDTGNPPTPGGPMTQGAARPSGGGAVESSASRTATSQEFDSLQAQRDQIETQEPRSRGGSNVYAPTTVSSSSTQVVKSLKAPAQKPPNARDLIWSGVSP